MSCPRFDIDTHGHAELRQARARAAQGLHVRDRPEAKRFLAHAGVAAVSEAWLTAKATGEKGFSNASFDADYLSNFPVAVVRDARGVIAFANLWESARKEELSVDLMRHVPDAPNGTMDYLFTEILLWGRENGFRWFNFGVAPLSGLATADDVTLWDHVGTLLYRHRRALLQLPGPAALQGEIRAGLDAALSRIAGWTCAAGGSARRDRARCGWRKSNRFQASPRSLMKRLLQPFVLTVTAILVVGYVYLAWRLTQGGPVVRVTLIWIKVGMDTAPTLNAVHSRRSGHIAGVNR